MQIVNGYVCATSCDVAAAKKGHDPKNPHDDPVKAAELLEQKVLSGSPGPAVSKSAGLMLALGSLDPGIGGSRNDAFAQSSVAPSATGNTVDIFA